MARNAPIVVNKVKIPIKQRLITKIQPKIASGGGLTPSKDCIIPSTTWAKPKSKAKMLIGAKMIRISKLIQKGTFKNGFFMAHKCNYNPLDRQ
jgi:hypothetical protein